MNLEDPSFNELVARFLNSMSPKPLAKKPGRARKTHKSRSTAADPWEELARVAQEDLDALEQVRLQIAKRPWSVFIGPYLAQPHKILASIRDAARRHDPVVKDLIDELYGGESDG